MIKIKNCIVIVLLLIVLITVFLKSVTANLVGEFGATGVAISPAIIKVTAKQGDTVETEIRIRNITKETVEVEIKIVDFEKRGDQIIFLDEYKDYQISPASWIELIDGNVYKLQPGEWKIIKAVVNVPEEVVIGEHATAVRLTEKEDDETMLDGTGH